MHGIRPLLPPALILGVVRVITTTTSVTTDASKFREDATESEDALSSQAIVLSSASDLETEVLRLVSSFERSVAKFGQRPSRETLHDAVLCLASAGLPWPAAGLATRYGTAEEVLHAFLTSGNVNIAVSPLSPPRLLRRQSSRGSGGMQAAAFAYLKDAVARLHVTSDGSGDEASVATALEETTKIRTAVMSFLRQLVEADASMTADLLRSLSEIMNSERPPALPLAFVECVVSTPRLRRELLVIIRSFDFRTENQDECVRLCGRYHVPEVAAELHWRLGATDEADRTLTEEFRLSLDRLCRGMVEGNGAGIVEARHCAMAVLKIAAVFVRRYWDRQRRQRAEALWSALLDRALKVMSTHAATATTSDDEVAVSSSRIMIDLRLLADSVLNDCRGPMPLPHLLNRTLASSTALALPLAEMRGLIRGVLQNLSMDQELLRSAREAAAASCRRGRFASLSVSSHAGNGSAGAIRGLRIDEYGTRRRRAAVGGTPDELEGLFFRLRLGRLPNLTSRLQFLPAQGAVAVPSGLSGVGSRRRTGIDAIPSKAKVVVTSSFPRSGVLDTRASEGK
eukprot:g4641.t1